MEFSTLHIQCWWWRTAGGPRAHQKLLFKLSALFFLALQMQRCNYSLRRYWMPKTYYWWWHFQMQFTMQGSGKNYRTLTCKRSIIRKNGMFKMLLCHMTLLLCLIIWWICTLVVNWTFRRDCTTKGWVELEEYWKMFQVFLKQIILHPDGFVVLAYLHNFLRSNSVSRYAYTPTEILVTMMEM